MLVLMRERTSYFFWARERARVRYSVSWGKLSSVLYMIWGFRFPSSVTTRISAMMLKRSLSFLVSNGSFSKIEPL